jgi:autotransporter adhesin
VKGDTGATGATGAAGANGRDGTNGTNGVDGKDGRDGVDGSSVAGRDGKDGAKGEKGDSANEFATVVQMNALRDEQRALGRNAYAGTASAIAAGSIPQAPEPGTKIIGAGAGYFRNEGAVAVGLSYRSESGRWITKASASVDTRGALGVGVGAAYVWK